MPIHPMIVAARGCSVDDFVRAFPRVDESTINVSTGWRWFLHPGIGLDPDAAEGALRTLPGIGLLVAAHEDAQWTLRLVSREHAPFELTHTFGVLLPFDEDPLEPIPDDGYDDDWDLLRQQERPDSFGSNELLIQMRDLYLSLPEGVAGDIPTDEPERFRDVLLSGQADRLVEALARLGIPHQAEAVRGVLRGDSVAPAELATRLGNAPRLLMALGFGEQMARYVDELCGTSWTEGDEWSGLPCGPLRIAGNPDELANVSLSPLEWGALEVPLRRFHHVIRAHLWCDEEAIARVELRYPEGADPPEFPPIPAVRVTREGRRDGFDFDLPGVLLSPQGRAFRKALSEVPEGTMLDIAAGPSWDDSVEPTRWRGTVVGSVWSITESNVAISPERWNAFVDLLDRIFIDAVIPCESGQERDELRDRLRPMMDEYPGTITETDDGFLATPFVRDEVISLFFRRRFGDLWPTATADAVDAQASGLLSELFPDSGRGTPLALAATAGCILEGDYCEVSLADTEAMGEAEGAASEAECAAWEAAGFDHLADVVVSTVPTSYCLCFISGDRTAYGTSYVDGMGAVNRWFLGRSPSGELVACQGKPTAPIEQGLQELRGTVSGLVCLEGTLDGVATALDEQVLLLLEEDWPGAED